MAHSGSKSPDRQEAEKWGCIAEEIAADYLRKQGYTVREQRWKGSGKFEVDIIAQADDTIILAEVKARKGDCQDPVDAVDLKKMKQMVRAADSYIGAFDTPFYYRFDIIAVTGNEKDYSLEHFPDAFLSPLGGPPSRKP